MQADELFGKSLVVTDQMEEPVLPLVADFATPREAAITGEKPRSRLLDINVAKTDRFNLRHPVTYAVLRFETFRDDGSASTSSAGTRTYRHYIPVEGKDNLYH